MELEQIKEKVCPHCGSMPTIEIKRERQENGKYYEMRRFGCGLEIEYKPWNPEIIRLRVEKPCGELPETKAIWVKRNAAKDSTLAHIKQLDLDREYKDDMLFAIKNV